MTQELLPYRELECENLDLISQQIYNFLNEKTDIINAVSVTRSQGWYHFNPKDLLINVPLLKNWFIKQKLILRDVAATVIRTDIGIEAHRDELPVIAKINFPVINTKNSYNVWWDDNGNEIARIEMFKPIAFNARLVHAVEMCNNSIYPRIVLSCMFTKDPTHLLVP